MDVSTATDAWRTRLLALGRNLPYVIVDTPQALIEDHLRRLTTFRGYSEEDIAAAELQLALKFSTVFRAFLREFGACRGDLFCGSHVAAPDEFARLRFDASTLMGETDAQLVLPTASVVFLMHQGYTFLFILGVGGFDGPVFQWVEGDVAPRQIASTFAELVDAELQLMEVGAARARETGGYYVILHSDGRIAEEHPALDSGDRPLDHLRHGARR